MNAEEVHEGAKWSGNVFLKDENVKFIFDYVTNTGIAASVIVGGFYLQKQPGLLGSFEVISKIFGWSLNMLGMALLVLNVLHGITKLSRLSLPSFMIHVLATLLNVVTAVFLVLLASQP